jgi:hypothetical protein
MEQELLPWARRLMSNFHVFLSDNFETHEAKVFFQRHYSEIYYICHDYFSIVEVNLRQKGKTCCSSTM